MPVDEYLQLLRCPVSKEALRRDGDVLTGKKGKQRYAISASGIPQFAIEHSSDDAAVQREHYDRIADAYVTNLGYPHTKEYMRYLDDAIVNLIEPGSLGVSAEICCGRGEAFELIGDRIGIDDNRSGWHRYLYRKVDFRADF